MICHRVRHTCGHVQEHEFRSDDDPSRRLPALFRQVCRNCYREQIRKRDAAFVADVKAARPDLTPLQGTEKQIAWGETCRAEALPHLEAVLLGALHWRMEAFAKKGEDEQELLYPLMEQMYREMTDATDALAREPRAGWWIENGGSPATGACQTLRDKFTEIARTFAARAEERRRAPTLDL